MRLLAIPSIRRAAVMALLCAAALGAHGATKEVAGSGAAVIAGTNANGSANTNTNANASTNPSVTPTPVDRITWLMPQIDATPASGNSGTAPRRVLTQTTADLLISNWGGTTQHELVMANIKRSLRMLQSAEPACMLGMLHTPDRDALAWFADTHLTPPHQFVVRASMLDKVPRNAAGEVRLERVWAERVLRGALVQGRSYGPGLDEMFRHLPTSALSSYVTPDVGGNLLAMVGLGRADYTLEYDFIVTDHLVVGGSAADLVTLPIEGHADPILSGVACPKTEWGRQVVMRANEVLALPSSRRLLKEELLNRLTPNARARYGARIEAFYARPMPMMAAGTAAAPAMPVAASGATGRDRVSPRSPSPPSPVPR